MANLANLRFNDMAPEILELQRDIEGRLLTLQPAIESTALELARTDPELARRFLTEFSVSQAESAVRRWRALGEHLLTKYNDGYVAEAGSDPERGYPEGWLREVIRARPEQFLLEPESATETELPY